MIPVAIPLVMLMLGAPVLEEGIYLDVPFVRQSPRHCGPAALAMSLRYWGDEIDHRQLAAASEREDGATGADLERMARARGFSTRAFVGTDEQLRQLLRAGRPVIVALTAAAAPNHYVLVVGATADEWVVHDPAEGPFRRIGRSAFAARWTRVRNWSLLVDRDDASPPPPAVTEPLHSTEAAAARPFWAIASGHFREGRRVEARAAVRRGLAHAPDDPYGHDFLATLLHLDGRTVEALHHWNLAGGPLLRQIRYNVPDAGAADTLSRLSLANEGEHLTRAQWLEAQWLHAQLIPRQDVRWRLVPADGEDWTLEIYADEVGRRAWRAEAVRHAVSAAFDRELSLDLPWTAGSDTSVAVRWDPARRRARVGWERVFVTGQPDRLRLAADVRDEAWRTDGSAQPTRIRSGEAGLTYDYFLASRRSASARLTYLRHSGTSFVVGGVAWQQTAALDAGDRVRLRWAAETDAFAPLARQRGGAQRVQASASLRWSASDPAATTAGAGLSVGAIRGDLPIDRQFVLGVGPDAPLPLRAHPTLRDGMKGGSPSGTRFALVNLDVERRLARWGLIDVRGLLFADHAVAGDRVYTDAGAGIKLRVGRQTIEALAGRDTRRGATRFWIGLSRDLYR